MISIQAVRYSARSEWRLAGIVAFYALICVLQLRDFLQLSSANFIIGCISIPFMIDSGAITKPSSRYAVVAIAFCLVHFLLPVKTALYIAVVAALLYTLETRRGKSSVVLLIALLLMSPIAQYFADAFSFPLRLKLTSIAGSLLRWMGQKVAVHGNVISGYGADFSVDPACMGMHMLVSSLLCALLVIALLQKRHAARISVAWITLILLCTIVLNAVANLVRIVLLVQFAIMPGTVMHEVVGILCLLVYVLIPLTLGLQWLFPKLAKLNPKKVIGHSEPDVRVHTGIGVLMVAGIALAPVLHHKRAVPLPVVSSYTANYYDAEIVKLQNKHALVYLKDLKGFYSSEHHPMICWAGEGYLFKEVSEVMIAGIPAISGTLQKESTILYTAWWYSSGERTTSSGIDWRWDAMRHGTPYSIVNVTAASESVLRREIQSLVADKGLNSWIDRSGRKE